MILTISDGQEEYEYSYGKSEQNINAFYQNRELNFDYLDLRGNGIFLIGWCDAKSILDNGKRTGEIVVDLDSWDEGKFAVGFDKEEIRSDKALTDYLDFKDDYSETKQLADDLNAFITNYKDTIVEKFN